MLVDASPSLAVDAEHDDGLDITTATGQPQEHHENHDGLFPLSPFAPSHISLLDISPFEWYDLLARDAISNTQKLNDLFNADPTWTFDEASLSRRQSPIPETDLLEEESVEQQQPGPDVTALQNTTLNESASVTKSWNTAYNIELSSKDLVLMRHYVQVVGPILDLFDPSKHFTNIVPHLSMRNIGLQKSILAVAARHMSLGTTEGATFSMDDTPSYTNLDIQPRHLATQYYYETLQYLSQTLLHPMYADSPEILATAMMISTYEMFEADVGEPTKSGDWERHLRGAFWIHRNQDNNAESIEGMRRAAWWAWLRQDIWAAFRAGRPTLTIYRPQRTIHEMNADDLASWAVFLAAKCVEFSAQGGMAIDHQNLRLRIDRGNYLLRSLQEWYDILPPSFLPMNSASGEGFTQRPSPQGLSGFTPSSSTSFSLHTETNTFPPIWIHPPNHAGSIQMYHFARTLVLLHQPSTGGLMELKRRQK